MPQGVRCPLWEAGLALFGVGLFSLGVFCYDREEVLTFRVNENWPKGGVIGERYKLSLSY